MVFILYGNLYILELVLLIMEYGMYRKLFDLEPVLFIMVFIMYGNLFILELVLLI